VTFDLYKFNTSAFITEIETVYCAGRTGCDAWSLCSVHCRT